MIYIASHHGLCRRIMTERDLAITNRSRQLSLKARRNPIPHTNNLPYECLGRRCLQQCLPGKGVLLYYSKLGLQGLGIVGEVSDALSLFALSETISPSSA